MNWNEDLMSSVRPAIDQAFRSLLDTSVENFKANSAQTIKEALRNLNHVLKSKHFILLHFDNMLITLQMTPKLWRVMLTRPVTRTT
jgi:hypothetical protein